MAKTRFPANTRIDSAGLLSIPLAGSVQGAGLTKVQLEQEMTQKLKSEYLRNPKVTVEVISYRPFYVLGEVQKPGEYQFRSGLNVLRVKSEECWKFSPRSYPLRVWV